jgi:hypothetical protein
MVRLQNSPVDSSDLIEYLNTSSDFAFELRCLEQLVKLEFQCQHGGSYTDPVTKKPRQFDIRAHRKNGHLNLRCAIECKNLTKEFPLLILCVPRAKDESFHELVYAYDPTQNSRPQWVDTPASRANCRTVRVEHPSSNYAVGESVGKSSAQVGRAFPDKSIISNDAEVFDKWSQALASADDLADQAAQDGEEHKSSFLSLILPILVVPDRTLWMSDYSANGTRMCDPVMVDRCSFFVGRRYNAGSLMKQISLTISHLEFVTLSGLKSLTEDILNQENSWFPPNSTIIPKRF